MRLGGRWRKGVCGGKGEGGGGGDQVAGGGGAVVRGELRIPLAYLEPN